MSNCKDVLTKRHSHFMPLKLILTVCQSIVCPRQSRKISLVSSAPAYSTRKPS